MSACDITCLPLFTFFFFKKKVAVDSNISVANMRNGTHGSRLFLKTKTRLGQCRVFFFFVCGGEWYIALHCIETGKKRFYFLVCVLNFWNFFELQSKQLLGRFYLNRKKLKGLAWIAKNQKKETFSLLSE